MTGSYELRDLDHAYVGLLYEGKLVIDKTYGHAAYGCGSCCGYAGPFVLDPDPFAGPPGIDYQDSIYATDTCAGDREDVTGSGIDWASSDTAVATLPNSTLHTVAVGSATGSALARVQWAHPPSCPTEDFGTSQGIGVTPPPHITSISPGSGQSGSIMPVSINGSNFGSSAPALSISGIAGTVNSVNTGGTQISASFNLTGLAPGTYSIVVSLSSGDGGAARSNSSPFTVNPIHVTTAELTVIGWINAGAIGLPSGENAKLQAALNTSVATCDPLLAAWAANKPTLIGSQADVNYANAWLLQHSGNAAPPATITPTTQLNGGDFRVFNDYQVSLFEFGGVISSASSTKATVEVGATPDPCGSGVRTAGQEHPNNGAQGLTPSATGIYELVEGRIGSIGQAISFTLNGRTVPWIWNVIEFNALGSPTTTNDSIFPTFSVYQNGSLVATYPQSSITSFIALDGTYQLLPSQIR